MLNNVLRKRILLFLLLVITAAGLSQVLNAQLPKPVARAAGNACGLTTTPVQIKHVIWIWEENHQLSQVQNSASAPYWNQLAQQCGYSSNLLDNLATSLPSEPQYAIGTSGSNCVTGLASSGSGCITNDSDGTSSSNRLTTTSIFQQLGSNWAGYAEGMPANCSLTSGGTKYAYKHNPPAFYTNISSTCKTNNLPLPAASCSSTANTPCPLPSGINPLINALSSDTLPAFTFIAPNLSNDYHDGTIQQMDNWLQLYIPKILASKAYATDHNTLIMVTFDESNSSSTAYSIPNLVIAPSVKPGTVFTGTANNVAYLKTIEKLLGLSYLGCATGTEPGTTTACPSGSTTDVSTAFNLAPGGSSGGGGGGSSGGDTQAPTTSITSPADGATINGTTTVTASASDNVQVSKVELYIDGVLSQTDTSSPYSFSVNATALSNGQHHFYTRAYDPSNNVGQSATVTYTVQSTAPTCTTPNPPNTYGQVQQNIVIPTTGTYRVWSRLKVPDSTNNSYYLQIDGGCPVVVGDAGIPANTWTWINYSNATTTKFIDVNLTQGSHQLILTGREAGVEVDRLLFLADTSCVPTGTGDNCVTSTVTPTVSLTSPTSGQTVSGMVNVNANANSVVNKVDFYLDGNLMSSDTSAPFTWVWNTSGASNGNHTLLAKASDANGTVVSSNMVTVNVSNAVSQGSPDLVVTHVSWSPTSPQAGDNVTFSASIKNQGSAATPAGKTIRTDFQVDGTTISWSDYSAVIAAGASVNVTATSGQGGSTTWAAVAGNHTVSANVDSTSQVTESNESNNSLSAPISVSGTAVSCVNDSITAPTLSLASNTMSQVNLAWTPSMAGSGCSIGGYTVFRDGIKISTLGPNALTYSDKSVASGQTYTYNVSAFDTAQTVHNSPLSNTLTVAPPVDDQAPTAPGNLTATAIGSGGISLSWQASVDLPQPGASGLKGYYIYRNSDTSPTFTVTDPTATSFTDTTVSASTTYKYVVTAIDNNQNESAPSNIATATTPGSSCTGTPSTPTGVVATDKTINSISLSWNASTAPSGCNIASYQVIRQRMVVGTVTSGTSFTDKNLNSNTLYGYTIVAVDSAGQKSAASVSFNVATLPDLTPPSVPGSVTATNVSAGQVRLGWTASTDNATLVSYRIYRNGTLLQTTSQLTFLDTTVKADTDYSYQVSAVDLVGNESAKANATPYPIHTLKGTNTQGPGAPTGLTAPVITATQAGLQWTASSGSVAGYHIYVNGVYDGDSMTTSFTEQCLQTNTTYKFEVVAFDSSANVSPPADLTIKTLPGGLTGDVDCNGQVDSSDLFTLLRYWQMPALPSQGDITGDGVVNSDDLFALLRNWGKAL